MLTLLLALSLLLLFLAIRGRHSGVFAGLGLGCLVLYMTLMPEAGALARFVFAAGCLLLGLELLLPTLGLLGLLGLGVLYYGLVLVGFSWPVAAVGLLFGLLLSGNLLLLLFSLNRRYRWFRPWILNNELTRDRGFQSNNEEPSLLGRVGTTLTPLRPVGKVQLQNGEVVQVMSDHEVIDSGERVEIFTSKNGQWRVRRYE